jgi:DNA invertase Pin-like site-specific DNA recombinase
MELEYNNIVCVLCNNRNNDNVLLICDDCDYGYHTYCINLNKVPEGTWYCPKCTYVHKEQEKTKLKVYNGIKVHIYERVSSKGQDQPEYGRVGLKVQNNALLEFCINNDITPISTTVEIGSAYKNGKTPKLNVLINKVKKGEPIIVYSVSRFSRNLEEANKMLTKIHNKWSYVWSITEGIKSHEIDFKNYIKSSENESKMLSNRMISSRKRIVDLKGFTGRKKPFGYSIYKDEYGIRRLKEHVLEQEVIKCIKDIYNSSEKYHKNFKKFKEFVNNEFFRYNFTRSDLIKILNNHYSEICTIKKSTSFVKDMIEGLKE